MTEHFIALKRFSFNVFTTELLRKYENKRSQLFLKESLMAQWHLGEKKWVAHDLEAMAWNTIHFKL